MKKSDELKQQRTTVEDKIQELAVKTEKSNIEIEELKQLHQEFSELEQLIDIEEKNEENAKRIASRNITQTTKKETMENYSFAKAIRDIVNKGKLEGLEAEAHAEAVRENPSIIGIGVPSMILNPEKRADLVAANSKLVPADTVNFIETLSEKLVVRQAGAQFLTGLTGNVSIPRASGGTAAWEGENTAANDFAMSFDDVTLTPKRLAAYQELSKQLLVQSPYNMEMILRNDMIRAISIAVDTAAINGTSPVGILQTVGIGSTFGGADGAAADWANIVELEKEVAIDNADMGALTFITNPKVRAALRAVPVGTDQRMVWPEIGNTLMGYNALVTTTVPSNLTKGNGANLSAIIFGNFNDLIVGQFGGLDIVVDPYSAAKTGKVVIVINSYWDVAVRHAQSFAAMKDAIA